VTVAVCATVKNEVEEVSELIQSLKAQSVLAQQIVIIDGGSDDGTLEALQEATRGDDRFVVKRVVGANIAAGRNLAIAETEASVIAVTDAGLHRSVDWLQSLVSALESNPAAAGAFGYVVAAPETTFEAALGAVVLPLPHQPRPERYPPSSGSVVFRRAWLERVGGYPEWLAHGEDLWLDRAVWASGGFFLHVRSADVGFRPRRSPAAFARQYFNYAVGDGQAGMLWTRHLIRFASYAFGAVLLCLWSGVSLAILVVLMCVYFSGSFRRAPTMIRLASSSNSVQVLALIPCLRVLGDLAKMAGFILGATRWRPRR
tara:strand:+ start:21175 stop:22119 length:945 start_codon:yes stop_codon:yes gene_type:complete